MNIFNKVTLQSIRKNRTRTVVTIIGVVLSVALLTAVTTMISSLQNYLAESEIAQHGNWHVAFMDVDPGFIERAAEDKDVASVSAMQSIGYAPLEGGQNSYIPYLFVMGLDDAAFENFPFELREGRLPQNDSEVIISDHIESNGGVKYKVGETIELPVGRRMVDGVSVEQETTFQSGGDGGVKEVFEPGEAMAYTVVGICARPGFENYSSPGYSVITRIGPSGAKGGGVLSAFVALVSPGEVYDYAKRAAASPSGEITHEFNRELLRYYGVSTNDNFNAVIYSLGAILIALIMVGSILLIYNSFAISISERSRQFGILSSVGATKKQIRSSVLFEGMYIGAIGIPLGVLVGLGGIGLTLELIGDITRSMSATDTPLRLHPSLPSIVIAAAVGVATILISAYIPAARAVRKSAIDIIRQADDINIKPKEVRTSNAVRRLFGLEGALALKSFKRNRKRYRSTVISLFVSVVLFISASAFGLYITQATVMTTEDVNYDLLFSPPSSWRSDDAKLLGLYEKMKDVDGVYRSAYQKDIDFSALIKKDSLNDRFLEYIAPGSDPGDTVEEFVNVRFIDDEAYDRYLKSLGLNKDDYGLARGRLPSVAKIMGYDESEQRTVSMDIFNKSDVTLNLTEAPGADSAIPGEDEQAVPPRELALTVVDAMPGEFSEAQTYGIDVYAPYSDMAVLDAPAAVYNNFSIAFLSNDPMKSADGIKAVMKDEGITSGYNFFNAAEELEQNRNNILIINIFIYGFIILISLITIANVFNTISTSINLRRREIAMLRSVGMGERSFGRMMNFECLFYGLKSLTYGLPVAVAVTWFIYRAVLNGVDVAFTLPWGSVAIGVFSVFFVVFVTMIYATAKMRRTNVIDALRDDMI